MKISVILASLVIALCGTAGAGEWSSEGDISRLRLHAGSTYFGGHSGLSSSNSQAACNSTSNAGEFSFGVGADYSDSLLSMLLAAEMGDRKVKVYLSGGCLGNRPEINGLEIQD